MRPDPPEPLRARATGTTQSRRGTPGGFNDAQRTPTGNALVQALAASTSAARFSTVFTRSVRSREPFVSSPRPLG